MLPPVPPAREMLFLASSVINAWNSEKNRQSSEALSAASRHSSKEIAILSQNHSRELHYNQLKASILQQQLNHDFQREMAELSHERALEIEAYRAEVNLAINQKNLDFQRWRFEQEKKIQYDILLAQQIFQRELSSLQQQQALLQLRERLREDKSPIANLASDLLENSFAQNTIPLKVILSPPNLDYDPSSGKPYHPAYESFLSNLIKEFLQQGYMSSEKSPVQLVDKTWESNKRGGGSALQSLHGQLKSIPVLVLDSEIALGELNFRVGFWAGGDVAYKEAAILSRESVSGLLNQIARQLAIGWQGTRQKLQDLGKDEAYIKTMGGIHDENLQILQREDATIKEFTQKGIDTSNLPIANDYKITDQHYKSFYEYLAVWHCLVIGHYADQHFLAHSWKNTPLLPSMIPYLMQTYDNHTLLCATFWQNVITEMVKLYSHCYNALADDASSHLPELRIQLAMAFSNLPKEYHGFAFEQGYLALAIWLSALKVPSDKVFDLEDEADCQLLKRMIVQEDLPFLENLQSLIEKLGDNEGMNPHHQAVIQSLLAGWQWLKRFGSIPHVEPVDDQDVITELHVRTPNSANNFTEMLCEDVPLEMIAIPAGKFMMGSDGSDDVIHNPFLPLLEFGSLPDHDSAMPMHKVKLGSFFIGKYPITRAQYKAIMKKDPSSVSDLGYSERNEVEKLPHTYPCQSIDWNDAQEFCQKLSDLTGKHYQLPTESQWEYACRAGTSTVYFFGEDNRYIHKYAHISRFRHIIGFDIHVLDRNEEEEYWTGSLGGSWRKTNPCPNCTSAIGLHKSNAWGLCDMLGNVWEWCQDDWIDGYSNHPSDGRAVRTDSDIKVIRGGSFESIHNDCYSFSRSSRKIDTKLATLGFRVVCTLSDTPLSS